MSLDTLRQDLRHAARGLVRTPAFTLVTILTLALGIGANTAIFSVVNGVLLRPLGYPQPDRLMLITSKFPSMGFEQFWMSPPEFYEFQEMNKSFAAVGAYATGASNLGASGERPRRIRTLAVSDDIFRVLGVQPEAGRVFAQGETNQGAPDLVVLSHELWLSAFGARPGVVGERVQIDGVMREVIGIMPPGFDLMDAHAEAWLPLGLNPGERVRRRGNHFLYLVGRLRDGVTPEQARAEIPGLVTRWDADHPKQHSPNPKGHGIRYDGVQEQIVGSAGRTIWVLQAAVGFVLLIACANLANLLLARAETRHREFAVRTALGASRGRLLGQFMAEGVLLSLAGGALGLGLAVAGVRALVALYPDSLPRTVELAVDPLVLAFALAVSLGTGVVFGFAPLLHTRLSALAQALKEGGARGATGSARHFVRRGLVLAEVALAVVLVIGAGLMLRTIRNLLQVDTGYTRAHLVTFSLSLPNAAYPDPGARVLFYQRLLAALKATPGVPGVAAMSGLPPNRRVDANDTDFETYTAPPEGPMENVDFWQRATVTYFDTMGIPIIRGRGFVPTDVDSGGVAIANETLVKTFFKDRDPIGQRLRPSGSPDGTPWLTIVGVAKDVKQRGVDQTTGTELYFLPEQAARLYKYADSAMNLVLRTDLPVATLRPTIESAVRSLDATLPVIRLRDMDEVLAESIARPRLLAQLLGGFAGLALLLAALGTYGVLSHMVAERRREIGIRMALGAERTGVVALVMRQGLVLTAVGLGVGLAGAIGLGRVMASLLFGVQPTDPLTMGAVMATIAAVGAAACALPAYRASRVDPVVVLRDE